jgi:hypothetical protein
MEYQGWSRLRAWDELRAHGFGETRCFGDNPYITQYLLDYRPGVRKTVAGAKRAARESHVPVLADPLIP